MYYIRGKTQKQLFHYAKAKYHIELINIINYLLKEFLFIMIFIITNFLSFVTKYFIQIIFYFSRKYRREFFGTLVNKIMSGLIFI